MYAFKSCLIEVVLKYFIVDAKHEIFVKLLSYFICWMVRVRGEVSHNGPSVVIAGYQVPK